MLISDQVALAVQPQTHVLVPVWSHQDAGTSRARHHLADAVHLHCSETLSAAAISNRIIHRINHSSSLEARGPNAAHHVNNDNDWQQSCRCLLQASSSQHIPSDSASPKQTLQPIVSSCTPAEHLNNTARS